MPNKTSHYLLDMFTAMEPVLLAGDRDRFSTIDNQLAFLSDVISDGVIDGWELTATGGSGSDGVADTIVVSQGSGLIGRFYTRTFDDIEVSLDGSESLYFYLRRNYEKNLALSPFSDIASVVHSDSEAPAKTYGLSSTANTHETVTLSWNSNLEPDLSYYSVERSLDDISYSEVGTSTSSSYLDTTVDEFTTYYYRVIPVDMTGNVGSSSDSVSVVTASNLSPPTDPSYVYLFSRHDYVQLLWNLSVSSHVDHYRIDTYELDETRTPINPPTTQTVSSSADEVVIAGLSDSTFYKFVVYAVSNNAVDSGGVSVFGNLVANTGPTEILDDITLYEGASEKNSKGVSLTVQWNDDTGVAAESPTNYEITVIENGSMESDPIVVAYDGTDSHSKVIDLFYVSGIPRAVYPRRNYIVKVQAVDAFSAASNGVISQVMTQNYIPPSSPFDFYANIVDKNLFFSWSNTADVFRYNVLSLDKEDIDTGVVTSVVAHENVGKEKSYTIDAEDIVYGMRYTVKVLSVDEFSNESDESSFSYDTQVMLSDPPSVFDLNGSGGDSQCVLYWKRPGPDETTPKYYKVWRQDLSYSASETTSWSLVETLPSDDYVYYVDNTAVNGGEYRYAVTVVDVFNRTGYEPNKSRESLADDEMPTFGYVEVSAVETEAFDSPDNLSVSSVANEHSASLAWDMSYDSFDGYDIFRSDGNTYSWAKVGSVDPQSTSFVDTDGLLVGGRTYYYMVRKFSNEAYVFSQESATIPDNGICLGRVYYDDGVLNLDTACRRDISRLEAPAEDYLSEFLDVHVHDLTSNHDRRIDLRENNKVETFTRVSERSFDTTEPVPSVTSYVALIDGFATDIFFEVEEITDTEEGTGETITKHRVTFEEDISSDDIALVCIGVEEVTETVPVERLGEQWGGLLHSGKIPEQKLPPLSHSGRVSEELIPLQRVMSTDDGYRFEIEQNNQITEQQTVGTGTEVYDAIYMPPDLVYIIWELMTPEEWYALTHLQWAEMFDGITGTDAITVATTKGIYFSLNGGDLWELAVSTDAPCHKIVFTGTDRLFAITSDSVYMSFDSVTWFRTTGLESVSVARDIIEASSGNLYLSTDMGVFKLTYSDVTNNLIWEQTAVFGDFISDTYAMWYDSSSDVVYASTPSAIYYTSDGGDSWDKEEIDELEPFYDVNLQASTGYSFAVSDKFVWRKGPLDASFSQISFTGAGLSRKVRAFGSSLLLSTDTGLLRSDASYDIYSDTNIEFVRDVENLTEINGKPVIVPCLNTINSDDEYLIAGTMNQLYIGTSLDTMSLHSEFEETGVVYPTIFVDNEEQKLGCYYSVDENVVTFDRNISSTSRVSIANQYNVYRMSNSGWLGDQYDGVIRIYQNGDRYNDSDINLAYTPVSELSRVSFDDIDQYDSNYPRAQTYISEYEGYIAELNSPNDDIAGTIRDLFHSHRKVYSQLLAEKVRFGATLSDSPSLGSDPYTVVDFEIAPFAVYETVFSDFEVVPEISEILIGNLTGYSVDVSTGMFSFTAAMSKTDNLRADVVHGLLYNDGDNLHDEIDAALENVNSGPSGRLADVQQSNLVKMLVALDSNDEGIDTQDSCNREIFSQEQVDYLHASEASAWYDSFSSTVEYDEIYYADDEYRTYAYPTAVAYYPETAFIGRVYVGFPDALVSFDSFGFWASHEVAPYLKRHDYDGEGSFGTVRDIKVIDDKVYVVNDYAIYYTSDPFAATTVTWSSLDTNGINEGALRQIALVGSTLVAVTDEAAYYQNAEDGSWEKTATVSDGRFLKNYNYVFLIAGDDLYYTSDGKEWVLRGSFQDMSVNTFDRYNSAFILATTKGLRTDNSTFYSGCESSIDTTLFDLENDLEESADVIFNDIDANDDHTKYVAGASDGRYWIFDGTQHTEYSDSDLPTIQKVLYVRDFVMLFGQSFVRVKTAPNIFELSGPPLGGI